MLAEHDCLECLRDLRVFPALLIAANHLAYLVHRVCKAESGKGLRQAENREQSPGGGVAMWNLCCHLICPHLSIDHRHILCNRYRQSDFSIHFCDATTVSSTSAAFTSADYCCTLYSQHSTGVYKAGQSQAKMRCSEPCSTTPIRHEQGGVCLGAEDQAAYNR